MFFDWITWSIWGIGLIILVLWLVETIKEFRVLLSEESNKKEKDS
jgi:heme exporter protein D